MYPHRGGRCAARGAHFRALIESAGELAARDHAKTEGLEPGRGGGREEIEIGDSVRVCPSHALANEIRSDALSARGRIDRDGTKKTTSAERLDSRGADDTLGAFGHHMRAEFVRWNKVREAAGIPRQ